jgi:hypothetical protein
MTKKQFKKLKVGDYVKVVTALFGYVLPFDNKESMHSSQGLGPWVAKVERLGEGMAYLSFQTSDSSFAKGLHCYPEILCKTKHKINQPRNLSND